MPDSHQAALWALWALWACLTGIQQPEQQTKTIDTPLKQHAHTKFTPSLQPGRAGACFGESRAGSGMSFNVRRIDKKIVLAFGRSALLPILIS